MVRQVQRPAPRPCESCPYRRDAPSGMWAEQEYRRLVEFDNDTPFQPPGVFLCHQATGRVCAGWAGCHNGDDLLGLRIARATGMMTPDEITATITYESPVPLFASGAEAAAHGLVAIKAPGTDATRAIEKLSRHRDDLTWDSGITEPDDEDPLAAKTHRIMDALSTTRFVYVDEIELHEGIVDRLANVGIDVSDTEREVRLSNTDRIDFLLHCGLGIEVKIAGTPGDVWRQLRRYARHDRVRALLLITTRVRHMAGPTELDGKPVNMLLMRGGLR